MEDFEINGKINFTSEFFISLTFLIFMQAKTLKREVWFRSNFLNTEIAQIMSFVCKDSQWLEFDSHLVHLSRNHNRQPPRGHFHTRSKVE